MLVCPNCGAQNQDGAASCSNCGAQFAVTPVAYGGGAAVKQPGKGLAIAGMVCGICSFFVAGLILGLLAIIFGAVAKKQGYKGGIATTGIVLGIIALVFYVVALLVIQSAYNAATSMLRM